MAFEVNKRGVILTAIILASICYILYSSGDEIKPDAQAGADSPEAEEKSAREMEMNLVENEDDDAYPEIGLDVEYTEDYVDVSGIKVFYINVKSVARHPEPTRFPILLLHGAAFTAETWKSLGTLQFLATSGYSPVAIDLPGFGKTKSELSKKNKADFMQKLISILLRNEKPVIVTPSMSGMFSLPYIFTHQSDVRGFVPIAPVNTYTESDYKDLHVPALIVYGTLDTAGEKTSKIIANTPKSRLCEIVNGKHPAYLDNPTFFHNEVKKFLDEIYMAEPRKVQGQGK